MNSTTGPRPASGKNRTPYRLKPSQIKIFAERGGFHGASKTGVGAGRLSRGRTGSDRTGGSGSHGPMKLPKARGPCPTGTVATTRFVAVSITDMVLSLVFAT